jgi:hypothetical protein
MKPQPITFSPEQWNDIADRTARMLIEEIKASASGIEGMVTFPLATITQITGLSRQTIPKRMPVIDAEGKLGVTLAALREWQERHTRQPNQQCSGKESLR